MGAWRRRERISSPRRRTASVSSGLRAARRANNSVRSPAPLRNSLKACVVTQKPGGTGKPAWVSSARFAPFPPTLGRSPLSSAAKLATLGSLVSGSLDMGSLDIGSLGRIACEANRRRLAAGLCENALDVLFGEEVRRRHHRRVDAREGVHRVLVALRGTQDLHQLGRRGLEGRELGGELESRERVLVAPRLVAAHLGVEGAPAGKDRVQRGDAELDAEEGVGDPERGDEVLVVAGIPDQRPAGTERLPEEVLHGRTGEALFTPGGADPRGEGGDRVERPEVVSLDVLPVRVELRERPSGD